MNHPIPEHLVDAVGADWDAKIDALRHQLLHQQGEAYEKHDHDFAIKVAGRLNDMSNTVEMARRIFNHYLATGDVEFPD